MNIDESDRPSLDVQILERLSNAEDSFVERKRSCQPHEVKRAVVAFANSLPTGEQGVLFLGVEDDGRPLAPEEFAFAPAEKKARNAVAECYPPIPGVLYRHLLVSGSDVLAVVVSHSPVRPHFSGKAYVRNGASSVEASKEMLEQLVEDRLSQVAKLRSWVGQMIDVWKEVDPELRGWRSGVSRRRLLSVDASGLVLEVSGASPERVDWSRVTLQPDLPGQPPLVRISFGGR